MGTDAANEGRAGRQLRAPARRWIALALAPLLVPLAYAADRGAHSGRTVRGVRLGDVDIGGLTAPEVERIARELGDRLLAEPVELRVQGAAIRVSPAELGARLDAVGTARRALELGRGGGLWGDFRSWARRWATPAVLRPVVEVDTTLLPPLLDDWEKRHVTLPFGGGVRVEAGTARADPARPGHVIARERARLAIAHGVASWPRAPVELPLEARAPFSVAGAVDDAVKRATTVLADAVTLSQGERTLRFEREDLARALRSREPTPSEPRVVLSLDTAVVEEKLSGLRAELEAPPENARFVVERGDRLRIEPGRSGTRLETSRVAAALLEAALGPERRGALPVEKGAEPAVTAASLEALRITRLVARFTTHHPCCQPRVDNIHRIADLLRGQIVKPGETFSVNALVGPRTAKNGFKPAPTIEEGEMVDALGGGVSQFATTLFNAVFLGGYDIVERTPHTFWFARYPMGRDATLSWPKPDVVFRNDSDAGVLIWTEYGDDHVTVKLFGDNGGRKVRFRVSPQHDLVKPPLEYIPDLTQSPDEERVLEPGQAGWTVVVTREVVLADGSKREDRRKVVYKPRTRRVVAHPCKIPAGEPGHSDEPCPEPDAGSPAD